MYGVRTLAETDTAWTGRLDWRTLANARQSGQTVGGLDRRQQHFSFLTSRLSSIRLLGVNVNQSTPHTHTNPIPSQPMHRILPTCTYTPPSRVPIYSYIHTYIHAFISLLDLPCLTRPDYYHSSLLPSLLTYLPCLTLPYILACLPGCSPINCSPTTLLLSAHSTRNQFKLCA